MEAISKEVSILSAGPNQWARKFSGYIVNGFRFHKSNERESDAVKIVELLWVQLHQAMLVQRISDQLLGMLLTMEYWLI